jgi:ABC-type Na+ efflux pump permease subunit
MELLLVAPVTEREIIGGQWRGWLRLFGVSILALLVIHVACAALYQSSFQRLTTAATAGTTTTVITNQTGRVTTTYTFSAGTTNAPAPPPVRSGWSAQRVLLVCVGAAATGVATLGNLLALCWFGLWMGMTSRTANLATLKTLLFVQVIPWFVIFFTSSMAIGMLMAGAFSAARSSQWLMWWPLVTTLVGAALACLKDFVFILWSRNKLYSSFREQATRTPGERTIRTPRNLPEVVPMTPPPTSGRVGI